MRHYTTYKNKSCHRRRFSGVIRQLPLELLRRFLYHGGMLTERIKTAAVAAALSLAAVHAAASTALGIDFDSMFNGRLKESDREILDSGGVVLRSVSSMKKLCVKDTEDTRLVTEPLRNILKSGYIAEIINFRPYEGNEDLVERIDEAMSDFLSYTEIPYWSEHEQAWFPLYNYAEVTETREQDGVKTIFETLEMDMFGRFHSRIDIENRGDTFVYRLRNTDKLKYKGIFTVIRPEKMQSVVAVFRLGKNWAIYAVGGANVIRPPFISERVEPAFTGRVKAFADFVFSRIDSSGGKVESAMDKSDASRD